MVEVVVVEEEVETVEEGVVESMARLGTAYQQCLRRSSATDFLPSVRALSQPS